MNFVALPPFRLFALTALALSLGWGIRGNFGHEFGAMIPGALGTMAVVLVSARADWHRRIHHFAFFGALGWSFGGSISYMQVIAYTHSGHGPTILYGFACLFVIGFLWAAVGSAGAALSAFLSREKLTGLFAPLAAVFVAWIVQNIVEARLANDPQFRHEDPLYWFDTDWLAALTAPAAVLLLAAVRRRWDEGSSLVVHMAAGWWIGFLLLVNLLGWRMTPPRGDNWAGCLGMTLGLWVWLWRQGLAGALYASLVGGFVGGFGFATAALAELIELKTGWQTNWHSILEQTYGLINGAGLALALAWAVRHAPKLDEEPATRRWTDVFAVVFVLAGVTWLNFQKSVGTWVKAKAWPETMHGLPAEIWFHLAYALVAIALILLLKRHQRRPLALLPTSWLGRGQWLFLVFLWWVVLGNFERALVSFQAQRLVTEGVIFLNAVICTLLLLWPGPASASPPASLSRTPPLGKVAVAGLAFMVLSVLADWGVTRAIYGDQPAGFHRLHIRFGPDATATKEKPRAGQPHP